MSGMIGMHLTIVITRWVAYRDDIIRMLGVVLDVEPVLVRLLHLHTQNDLL